MCVWVRLYEPTTHECLHIQAIPRNDVLSELVHRRSFAFKAMGDALVAQMRDEFERFYELTGHGALEPIALFFRCSAVA